MPEFMAMFEKKKVSVNLRKSQFYTSPSEFNKIKIKITSKRKRHKLVHVPPWTASCLKNWFRETF